MDTFTYTSSTTATTSGSVIGVSISNSFTFTSDNPLTTSGAMDIQSNLESPVITPGDSIRINGIEITFTGTTVSSAARDINSYGLPGITASTENGQLRLNSDSKVAFNVLAILPGVGDVIQKLGLQIYPYTQAI